MSSFFHLSSSFHPTAWRSELLLSDHRQFFILLSFCSCCMFSLCTTPSLSFCSSSDSVLFPSVCSFDFPSPLQPVLSLHLSLLSFDCFWFFFLILSLSSQAALFLTFLFFFCKNWNFFLFYCFILFFHRFSFSFKSVYLSISSPPPSV